MFLSFVPMLISLNCVAPEEPTDGLLENLPAIVNTADAFTFSLKGNQYSFEETYTLVMNPDSNSVLNTSLIVTGWSGRDTSKIFLINESDSSYAWYQITGNMIYTRIDELSADEWNHPKKLLFTGNELTGIIQFSMIKE